MPDFASWASDWWKPILFVIVAGHFTNVCVTLFLHRAQTHRGVRLHALAALPMRIWLWLTTAIVTKEWVACHRKHHAFADREGDPHSPLMEGLRNIVLKGAFYYRKAVRQPGVLEKYGKGTPSDWIERHLLAKRNYDVKDESRNISPIAIWLGGEELHNNHHADPHSAKFGHKWYEFDIGWVYIRLLSLFGLAKVKYAHGVAGYDR